MADPGIGELLASTDEKRMKKPSDMVANANILYHQMKKIGNVKEDLEGKAIYEEFRFAQNGSYQAINPTDEIDLTFNNTLDAFVYTPKQSVVAVMISEVEKAMNRGPMGVLNLLKERGAIGESTMVNEIATDLNGDGTGRGGKAFNGIRTFTTDSPASGTTGGVSRTLAPAIRNQAQNFTSSPHTGATTSANIEDRILELKNRIFKPTAKYIGYAGSTYFRLMASAIRGRQDLVNQELKSEGFGDHIVVEGIPFFLAGGYNPQGGTVIAADRLYIFDPAVFKFRTYRGYNMQALPNRVSTKQLVDVALRVSIGQFTCNDPSQTAVGFET